MLYLQTESDAFHNGRVVFGSDASHRDAGQVEASF